MVGIGLNSANALYDPERKLRKYLQGGKIEQSGESRTCILVYDKLNERYLCKNDRISSCNILDNNDELNIQLMQILLSKEIK